MKKITEVDNLRGKFVLLRASLNIPVKNGELTNKYRLNRALPTLRYLHEQGARTIILSHIGRDADETLKPVFNVLEKHLPMQWGGKVTGDELIVRKNLMDNGDILMAENLRQDTREKGNDEAFAAQIAKLGDIYVNDAFAEVHRKHASTYGVAKLLPAYAGLNLIQEVSELSKVMKPVSPSLLLLGGAKFETKMPLVKKYLELYDKVFIAGALMNDIFKAQGLEVGESLVSDNPIEGAAFLKSDKLILPIDVRVSGPDGKRVTTPDQVKSDEKILDCGPQTVEMLATYIEKAKTILWNGPFGAYEMGYTQSTEVTARHVAASDAFTVVGGGDTVAAIEKLGINDQFSFVSIGGGSMLNFLETGSTPVIDLLN